jgi:hypothetical protein
VNEARRHFSACLIFLLQAAFETLYKKWPDNAKVKMLTKFDYCLHTRRTGKTDKEMREFETWSSMYADDCMLLFDSKVALIYGTKLFRFGLEMHLGRNGKPAKSVTIFVPADFSKYDEADLSEFEVDGLGGCAQYVKEFKYLGSIIHASLKSIHDVQARMKAASKVFGALRKVFTDKSIALKVKGTLYNALVMSILLYGCESWKLLNKQERYASSHQ